MNDGIGPTPGSAPSNGFKRVLQMNLAFFLGVLALLILIATLSKTLVFHSTISDVLAELAQGYKDNLPPLRFEDGEMIVEGAEPAFFPNPDSPPKGFDSNKFVIIFDTSGSITKVPEEYEGGVLVTSDTLFMKDKYTTREIPLAELHELTGDFVLNGDFIEARRGDWARLATIVAGIFLVIYATIAKLIQALLLGLVGQAMSNKSKKLPYGDCFKIATLALGPAILLEVFFGVAGAPLPFLAYFGIAIASLWWGTRHVTRSEGGGPGGGQAEMSPWSEPRQAHPSPQPHYQE